jgi:hypothetical protein
MLFKQADRVIGHKIGYLIGNHKICFYRSFPVFIIYDDFLQDLSLVLWAVFGLFSLHRQHHPFMNFMESQFFLAQEVVSP